jgi:bifunctional DNA-binding transcriptional regulator/antitoxin component of YhaV-PrlF toxin-antitoxin module
MSKVTSKFQIALSKRLVETYGIQVGDQVEMLPADPIVLEVIQLGHAFRAVARQQSRAHGVPIDSSVKIRGKQ